MAITIRGIKIKSISISCNDDGDEAITSAYQLISSTDKVLAKENLSSKNEYGTTQFVPSAMTKKALTDAVAAYRKEVEASLGIE